MRVKPKLIAICLVTILMSPMAGAAGIDLHWLWDDRCAECHGHSGNFSRMFLNDSNGELQGRHHVNDLRQFMQNHYLIDSEVDAVYNMLLAQTGSDARFKKACSSCHISAVNLVRNSLVLRESQLFGRESGRPVHLFLNNHMGLSPDDVNFFTNLLRRVANEVYRP